MSNAGLTLGIVANLALVAAAFGLAGAIGHYGLTAAISSIRSFLVARLQ